MFEYANDNENINNNLIIAKYIIDVMYKNSVI